MTKRTKEHFHLFSSPTENTTQLLQNTVALKHSQLHCVPDVLFNKMSFRPSDRGMQAFAVLIRVSSMTNYGYREVNEAY